MGRAENESKELCVSKVVGDFGLGFVPTLCYSGGERACEGWRKPFLQSYTEPEVGGGCALVSLAVVSFELVQQTRTACSLLGNLKIA